MKRCNRPGCDGGLDATGYCRVCLMPPLELAERRDERREPKAVRPVARKALAVPAATAGDGPWWGLDLITLPVVDVPEPAAAVRSDLRIPEEHRKCPKCEEPVGVGHEGQPSLVEGRCPYDGTPYSFVPRLRKDDVLADRYRVEGCLGYGGFGWVYLAYDQHLDNRPVALKGLINADNPSAVESAQSEKRFLISLRHRDIVEIRDFVTHTPRSGGPPAYDGYIVMEYVPGHPLTAPGLPALRIEQVIGYVLRVLRVFHYLHGNRYYFCDLKPSNLMAHGSDVTLIDLGGVRDFDDDSDSGARTKEYAAPELPLTGPTVATELFTVGRTLEDLCLWNAQGHELPLSLRNFIDRATHSEAGRRFESAADMANQLSGVLRELVTRREGRPRPTPSFLFPRATALIDNGLGAIPELSRWTTRAGYRAAVENDQRPLGTQPPDPVTAVAGLPEPVPDAGDLAAEFLVTQVSADPAEAVRQLTGYQSATAEVELRRWQAHLRLRELDDARAALHRAWPDLREGWRKSWHAGLLALVDKRFRDAELAFTSCYQILPGELAPRLALALCAEYRATTDEELDAVAAGYLAVWRADTWYESAAVGHARVRARRGDRAGAVAVLSGIPNTSPHYRAAQVAAFHVLTGRLTGEGAAGLPGEDDLADAERRLAALGLSDPERQRLAPLITEARLARLRRPPTRRSRTPKAEHAVRLLLEKEYRDLARQASPDDRRGTILTDLANAVRPMTLR